MVECSHLDVDIDWEIQVLNSATELMDEIVIGYNYTEMLRCHADEE